MRRYLPPIDRAVTEHHWNASDDGAALGDRPTASKQAAAFNAARDSALTGTPATATLSGRTAR